MNKAIATAGSNALVLGTEEENLGREVSTIELNAMGVVIQTDADYAAAAENLKAVKRLLKKVNDYWEPLRVAAKKTYDSVLARKKQMTFPLENSEKILKSKMADYNDQKERKRREREGTMRILAQREAEAKLIEAVIAEEAGDIKRSWLLEQIEHDLGCYPTTQADGKKLYVSLQDIVRLILAAPKHEPAEHGRCGICDHYHIETGYCNLNSFFIDSSGQSCSTSESPNWKDWEENDFCSYFKPQCKENMT